MTSKEIRILGMALKALMKAKMYEDVENIADAMAEKDGAKKQEENE